MTDNEIIKALEFCIDPANAAVCKGCYYYDTDCSILSKKDALDLINRQRAEIEQYKDYNAKLHEKLRECRAEAVKEFAERVKQEFDKYRLEYKEVMNDDGACAMIIAKKGIDIVLKESRCE